MWIPAEAEKVEKDGRETAGIRGVARLLHSRRQLVRSKLNCALGQIVGDESELQSWQHYQYRHYGKNRGKTTMLKKSLQEIQHPGSNAVGFRSFHLIWSIIVADLHK
jgi:hypothetical protein